MIPNGTTSRVTSREDALAHVAHAARALGEAQESYKDAVIHARKRGASIRGLAEAAECSPSRVYDLVRRSQAAAPSEQAPESIGDAAENIVVVAGGPHGAYGVYRRFGVYACQPQRFFRPTARYVGFYYAKRIYPEFGAILDIAPSVRFSDDSLAELRTSGDAFDAQIADIASALRAEGIRDAHTHNQIVVLSPVGDARTLTLSHPIHHPLGGAWTRNQRYISSSALQADVTSTLELGRLT